MIKRVLSFVLAVVMVAGLVWTTPVHTHAASEMTASEECASYLKSMEGFLAIPVWDIAQWTVGFGTRCPDEDLERYKKDGIPMEEAHALFAKYLSTFAGAVNKFLDRKNITLTQNQFDALVCLAYNKGDAWMYRDDDPLVQAILKGDMGNEFISAMTLSVIAGGNYLPGLLRRRLTEANMYINGVYSLYEPDNYCHVLYDGNGGIKSRSAQGYDCNLPAEPTGTATRDGYTFLGWYTASDGGSKVTELTRNTDGMTLYAHWDDGNGDINGGSGEDAVLVKVTASVLNIRSGPGSSYDLVGSLTEGTMVGVLEVQEVGEDLWGKISQGWICLTYTNYAEVIAPPSEPENPGESTTPSEPEEPVEDPSALPEGLPLVGTVIGNSIIVYNGPHVSYPQLGTVEEGKKVTITETYELFGVVYGKCDAGWVRTDRNLLFDGYQLLAHSFTATVTGSYAYVRSGPGTGFGKLTTLYKNATMTVEAILAREGYVWGMTSAGWVALSSTDYNSDKLSDYQNHSYGQWVVTEAATCSEAGQERRECSVCGHSETRASQQAAHQYGDWQALSASSCSVPGQRKHSCTVCGYEEIQNLPLASHSYGDWWDVTIATCTSKGQQRRDCEECGHFETRTVAAAAHSYGDWYETAQATDTLPGQERRDCAVCGGYELRNVPKTEHTYGAWYVTKTPTCTEKGMSRRDCTHCGHYETRELNPTGHTLGSWKRVQSPSCTQEGEDRRTCADCGYYESRMLSKIGHSLGAWQVTTAATCVSEGVESRICADCKYAVTRSIPKTEHSYGDWTVSKAATYTEKGEERRDCVNCDHYETRETACKPAPVEKTYGTLTGYSFLNIRAGLGTGYDVVGKLSYGERVEILEQQPYNDQTWGRIDRGWICLTGYMTLETVLVDPETGDPVTEEPGQTTQRVYATITVEALRIREGAGTQYQEVGFYSKGTRVEILEQTVVGDATWGRTDQGWICLTGYTTLETVQGEGATSAPAQIGSVEPLPQGQTKGDVPAQMPAEPATRQDTFPKLVKPLKYRRAGGSVWICEACML